MQKSSYLLTVLLCLSSLLALGQSNEQIPKHQALIENTTNYQVVVDLLEGGQDIIYLKLGPGEKRYHTLYKPGARRKVMGRWWMRLRTHQHKEHRRLQGKTHYLIYYDKRSQQWKAVKKRRK